MGDKICFVGAGNMATSLIGGMIANQYAPEQIMACDINPSQLDNLHQNYNIRTSSDSLTAAGDADVVMLAIKPQMMSEVCGNLSSLPNNPEQLFISIAAGVPATAIESWLGGQRSIVRCMPNTPALLQLGASGLFANQHASAMQKKSAEQILSSVGITIWVAQENDLDAVTAISGSGPAYFFYFIELLEASAIKLGLSPDTAARLARQTALGAASMAMDQDVVKLRQQVTSKKGTTDQAIQSFQHNDLAGLVEKATAAAKARAEALAAELTGEK